MNIVLTRLQNIGDMLNFIPALRTLRRALPEAKLIVLAKHAGGLEILKNCPYCDKVVTAPKSGAILDKFRMRRELREFGPIDYFIISPQDTGRVPWALFCGARHISAYPAFVNYGELRREKLTNYIDLPCVYDQSLTEIENCLRPVLNVLEHLNVPLPKDHSLALEYSWYGAEDKAEVKRILRSCGLEDGEDYVVMAPVSKRSAKNWPSQRLVRLLRAMGEEWRVKIFLLGGKAEKEELDALAGEAEYAVSLAGKTTLAQTAAIMAGSVFFFGVDSGPAFLAAAQGVPSVVLYGPADFYRWRPPVVTSPRLNLFKPFPCSPCREQVCPRNNACLAAIGYDEVWQACKRFYHPEKAEEEREENPAALVTDIKEKQSEE
ncbi:glycosyltransferase family 9 protein [bacterium]|nr:glycosyltransferase family 9 protein [bacterium]